MEKIGSPVFFGNVKAIRHKIASSFPQEQRGQIQSLRNRITIGCTATEFALESLQGTPKPAASALYEAFFEKRLLSIVYQDAEGKGTRRVIEAQYLFLHWPIWYILAWDHLRVDVRCFRLDRISKAKIEDGVFKLKSRALFTKNMENFISILL